MRAADRGPNSRTSDSRSRPDEQFHHVVERAVLRDAEVEDLNRVRRAERGGGLRLALEAAKRHAALPARCARRAPRAHQLDRRIAGEQAMLGAPHLAHAAVPELLDQVIAAELLRFFQTTADAMEHLGGTTTTKAHA